MSDHPAIILRHPACPPVELIDPREPPHPHDDEFERAAVVAELSALIAQYGGKKIMTVVKNLAHLAGEEV